jgi:hypothetical protein
MISLKHIKIQKTNKSFICWMGRGKKNSSWWSRLTAINNKLFMHGQNHQSVTVNAIQFAYHGRKDTRWKVYELRTKRIKKRKRDATIINIITIIIIVQIYMMLDLV